MRRDLFGVALASAILLLAPRLGFGGDEAKHECRQGCEEAQRSCKADCGPRDSGDLEASQQWVDCDAGCHETYTGCVDACADDD